MSGAIPGAVQNPAPRQLLRLGPLLLLTYLAHLAEEYWGGMGFPAWVQLHAGIPLTLPVFLQLNSTFFAVMAAGVLAGWRVEPARWLYIPLGTAVLINGALHLIASIVTLSYSPGVLTGALLWVPLGGMVIRTASSIWPRRRITVGILLGVGLHLLVPAALLLATR